VPVQLVEAEAVRQNLDCLPVFGVRMTTGRRTVSGADAVCFAYVLWCIEERRGILRCISLGGLEEKLCDLAPIFKLWKLKGIGRYYNVHWDSDMEAIGTAG
jgi:hypothetical protein